MKDHNFVPFNYYEQWCNGSNMKIHVECADMFAPEGEVLEGFLGWGFCAKKGLHTARFLLPTGCIQEVHVAQGESALEAFRRWRDYGRARINAHRYEGTTLADFSYRCNLCECDLPCKEDAKLMALAGELY
jgi:hypothetical protein